MRYPKESPPAFTLTSGPVDAYPEVLRALASTVIYDYDPAFQLVYEKAALKAQKAMATPEPPLILHGEPVLALEATAASLIAKDDCVLNLASGVYGKGFGYWAARYAAKVEEIEVPYDECVEPEAVQAFLKDHPEIKVVAACHHDTPSGTLNDVDAIGEVVAEAGALLIVDAVSSWGGMRTTPGACRAGVYVTGPNKCLGCPPALSLAAVSSEAWDKIDSNPDAPTASMLSLTDWRHAWKSTEPFPFTPSVSEVNGLDAALDRYLNEGPERVWARHDLTAAACRDGVRAMGLDIWPAREEIASPTTTAVKMPQGADAAKIIAVARTRYGVMLSAGRGDTEGKLIRIGHMGPSAQPMYALIAIAALGGAMAATGVDVDVGSGLVAAQSRIDASG
ncbi:MAG: alanine--glyoxylate aminotransferase family protein [Albidovulum sp.]|nr:alanine--glyoxylate aminotransferase family protein [Albidovulum sp.]